MFGFDQDNDLDLDRQQLFGTCTHLQDVATEMGIDTGFGINSDMTVESLQEYQDALQAAVLAEQEKIARERRGVCHIGHWRNGFCVYCGGRQP